MSIQHATTQGNCCRLHFNFPPFLRHPQPIWNITVTKVQNTPRALCPLHYNLPSPGSAGKEPHCRQTSQEQEELGLSLSHLHPTQLQHRHLAVFLISNHNQKGPDKHVSEQWLWAAAASRSKRQDLLISCWATEGEIGWSCVKRGGEQIISQTSGVSKMTHLVSLRRMMKGKQGYQIKKKKNKNFSGFPSFLSPF